MRPNFRPHKNKKRRFNHVSKSASTIDLMRAISNIKLIKNDEEPEQMIIKNGFNDFGLTYQVLNNIKSKGYTTPTPIQDQTIPIILRGQDVIGIANTGTGKTAAFLIPLIEKVFKNKHEKVIIITPTRELAVQIEQEFNDFSKGLNIKSVLCIGGLSIRVQKENLKNNPNFVIGTPGRIKDLINEKSLFLSLFHSVVLDEADRMVDIGFISEIKYFISLMPQVRHSLFFSATVSPKVNEILRTFVKNPVKISVKQQENAENIHQDIIKLENGYTKINKLHDLLAEKEFSKVLIFARTKWGVQRLTDELIKRGFKAGAIHGNKSQNQRQRVLEQFKNNQLQILLATDVASRGLDIPDISHVINYDMPSSMEDYTHRIGRTGRANKRGIALTFVE